MTNFLIICITTIFFLNGIEIRYYKKNALINDSSDCSFVFENNKAYKCNILDSAKYEQILDSDSIRITGMIKNHEFQSSWYSSTLIETKPITIGYQDSIPKDSIHNMSLSCTEYYFNNVKVTIGNSINHEYYWNEGIEFYIDGVRNKN